MNPRRTFWAALLVATAATAVVYGRSLGYPFIYDDLWTIVRNPAVKDSPPPVKFFTDASTVALPEMGMGRTIYRPLPTWSFALNFRAASLNPAAWREPDFLLHALNGVLVFLLFAGLLGLSREAAVLGAAVFLFHPAQVESVVWITQRSNLMCSAGGLAALLLSAQGNVLGLLCYAAAILSKETAVTLAPFVMLAAFSSKEPPRRKMILAAGALLLATAYLPLRAAVAGGLSQRSWRGGWGSNFLIGQASWWEYLKLLAWPVHLTASHDQYVGNPWESPAPWIGAALLVLWLAGTAVLWRRGAQRTALACAWVPVTLSPHLGLLPLDTFAAERFLYLPVIGIAALAALAFDAVPPSRKRTMAAFAVLPLLLAAASFRRTAAWRDDVALWRAAVGTEPENAFAHFALADALYAHGRHDESAQATREGLTLHPSVGLAFAGLNNLSDIAFQEDRPRAALLFADKALRIRRAPQAELNRARALDALKKKTPAGASPRARA